MTMRLLLALAAAASCAFADAPVNLAQSATARSWGAIDPVAEHEPARLNDGSLHSYWSLRAENIPGDAGLEWHTPQTLASLVVRYFDGRMARSATAARTQHWATVQAWLDGRWRNLDARVIGEETSTVRYVFPPVTTARLRLLFREPPDPELRRTPDRLGIHMAELEAYANVPFQWVESNRVDKSPRKGGYEKLYNEAPAGDGHYDVAGPLIIDPKPSRLFRDTLRPTLIVAESRWAETPCTVKASPEMVWLANGFLQLELSTRGGLHESGLTNLLTEEPVNAANSVAFELNGAGRTIRPTDLQLIRTDTAGSTADLARVRFDLAGAGLAISVHYELQRRSHFYHKWLTITRTAPQEWLLRDVTLTALNLPGTPADLMAGQELTYPVFRMSNGGFFSALEAVYWDHIGDVLTYYPAVTLKPAATYTTERAAVGVYKNTRERIGGWDRGVREWIGRIPRPYLPGSRQLARTSTSKAGPPTSASRKRATNPTGPAAGSTPPAKLGVTDIDAYEPYHQASQYSDEVLRRFTGLASEHGIRTGLWFRSRRRQQLARHRRGQEALGLQALARSRSRLPRHPRSHPPLRPPLPALGRLLHCLAL